MEEEKELEKTITDYIHNRYSSSIKGKHIIYGKAIFSIEMLVSGSIDTYKRNPDRDLFFIVDYMFDYYCT